MSWLSKIGMAIRSTVVRAHPRDPVLVRMLGLDEADAGVQVDATSAMRVAAVYACVALIAETIAALPLHLYRRNGEQTTRAVDHPLYSLLHDAPAPGLTAFDWREAMITSTALIGDSYSRIVTRGNGKIDRIELLRPDRMQVEEGRDGRPVFVYAGADGGQTRYSDDQILRIPFKMVDGLRSMSPIEVHRNTIGLAIVSQRYLNRFYRNSAQPKGALTIPTKLDDSAVAALRAGWERRHMGPENSGRVAILDGGMEWKPIGMTMEDAQYVELTNLSVTDIARIYGIPPHKIGDLSKATFSNIEHQAIEFVTGTLLRWCRRIESRMNMSLLTPRERQSHYIAFDLKGLLRGDAAARAALYSALFNVGAMSPNEIRRAEDMNPYESGDRYYFQGAYVPVEMIDAQIQAQTSEAKSGKAREESDNADA